MKSFIYTAFHAPTMTTVDDPLLKVIEVDNGISWNMYFLVGHSNTHYIDIINMEHPKGNELHPDIKTLRVYDDENNDIGSVEERLAYAIKLDEGFDEIMLKQYLSSKQEDEDIDFE